MALFFRGLLYDIARWVILVYSCPRTRDKKEELIKKMELADKAKRECILQVRKLLYLGRYVRGAMLCESDKNSRENIEYKGIQSYIYFHGSRLE